MDKPVRTRKRAVQHTDSPVTLSTNASAGNDPRNALALAVAYVDPATLKPPPRRLRVIGTSQMAAIRASIAGFGFLNPILVDGSGRIICGHARWMAAKDLGLATVPTIYVDHLTDEQKRLYAIAENRSGELGEWDNDALRHEFGEMADLGIRLDLNLEVSGFTMSEIDDLLIEPAVNESESEVTTIHPPVMREGDLWILGKHRLLCGDALEDANYERLLNGEKAQMAFVDAPYNQPMNAILGKGRDQNGEFAMASGELSREEFTKFLTTAFGHMAQHSIDGAIH